MFIIHHTTKYFRVATAARLRSGIAAVFDAVAFFFRQILSTYVSHQEPRLNLDGEMLDFPGIVSSYSGVKPVTKTWRNIMRQKAIESYSLQEILLKTNQTEKNPILKEICHDEMKQYIFMRRNTRNSARKIVSVYGARQKIPIDIINNILEYTTFVKRL
jgi:hypothetical protein